MSAILAVELATAIVYHGGWELDFENRLKTFAKDNLTSHRTER
jgi:hypothetical protein